MSQELLKALVDVIDDLMLRKKLSEEDAINISDSVLVRAEIAIESYLAQPEQEPTTRHALDSYWNQEAYQRGYLKREPLSDEEVSELLMGGFSTHLMDLVRMVEKAHGIGGG